MTHTYTLFSEPAADLQAVSWTVLFLFFFFFYHISFLLTQIIHSVTLFH